MQYKQMRDIAQQGIDKITLVDAVGNRIPIPMQWCRTYSVRIGSSHSIRLFTMKQLLAGIIRLYFEDQQPPGSSLVKRGRYHLISGKQKEAVEPAGWTNIVFPGLTIEMSMVLHDRNKKSRNCPRCCVISGGVKNEWVTWKVASTSPSCSCCDCPYSVRCKLQFQITDQVTVNSDDVPISPTVCVSSHRCQILSN
jgi:hypothetical protein